MILSTSQTTYMGENVRLRVPFVSLIYIHAQHGCISTREYNESRKDTPIIYPLPHYFVERSVVNTLYAGTTNLLFEAKQQAR